MDNSNVQTSPNEEEKQPHSHSEGHLKWWRRSRSRNIRQGEAVPKSCFSWSADYPKKWPISARPNLAQFSECSDNNDLYNHRGRAPLNRDFGADRAQPLPFSNEDEYGGGSRLRIGGEEQVVISGNRSNGAPVKLPVPPTGVKSKQKPTHPVDLSVTQQEVENYTIKVSQTAHQQSRHKSQEQPVKLVVPSNGMKPEQKPTHRVSRFVKVIKKNKGCFSCIASNSDDECNLGS